MARSAWNHGEINVIRRKDQEGKTAQPKLDPTLTHEGQPTSIRLNLGAAESIRAMAPLLERELIRCEKLQKQVDAAFGNLFLSGESPVSPKNQQRFKKYFEMTKSVAMLKFKLIHEFMRVHGVDPARPHQMYEISEATSGIGTPAITRPQVPSDQASAPRFDPGPDFSAEETRVGQLLMEHLLNHERVKKPFKVDSYGSRYGDKQNDRRNKVH